MLQKNKRKAVVAAMERTLTKQDVVRCSYPLLTSGFLLLIFHVCLLCTEAELQNELRKKIDEKKNEDMDEKQSALIAQTRGGLEKNKR